MSPFQARRLLGIAADADKRAIRRAYADRLRALDVEADPDGFARLRAARDAALAADSGDDAAAEPASHEPSVPVPSALAQVRQVPALPDQGLAAPVLIGSTPATPLTVPAAAITATPFLSTVAPEAAAATTTGAPDPRLSLAVVDLAPDPDDPEVHAAAIWRLLLPPDGRADPLDADEVAAVYYHLDRMLGHPAMDAIDFRVRAEHWFADLIEMAGDRADPILARVVTAFAWDRDRGALHQPPAIAAALARHDDARFVAAVALPGHPLHRAWNELAHPRGSWRNLLVGRRKVAALLTTIRRDHPAVEQHLDGYRVSQWEHRTSGGWRTTVFVIWALIMVVRLIASGDGPDAKPIVSADPPAVQGGLAGLAIPLSSFERDVAPLLRAAGGEGLTLTSLSAANPAYATLLRDRWRTAKAEGRTLPDFADEVAQDIEDRYNYARYTVDYPTLAAARRLQLDRARTIRDRLGTLACTDHLNGRAQPDSVIRPFQDRQRQVVATTLLRMDGVPKPRGDGTLMLPVATAREAASRAGLSKADFDRAIDARDDPHRCVAWIGLLEAVLALPPRQGLPLLRGM